MLQRNETKETLTKAGIADQLYTYFNRKYAQSSEPLTREEALETIESLIEIIKRTLESGEEVMISGFGKFAIREKRERRGRNPATGEDMVLKARRVVNFSPSKVLKDLINSS